MPPKNKKQLEEEAKRLEEQQKRKQQQQRLLQQERKKYAAQRLNTELILPVSNQLLKQFTSKQNSFVIEKLRQVLSKYYADLKDETILKQVLKQMLYCVKSALKLFSLNLNDSQDNQDKYLKVRVLVGLSLQIYLNNHPALGNQRQKNKADDQNLLKQLLLNHSQGRGQNQQKIFNKTEIGLVLNYMKQNYFNHFLIMHRFNKFNKREDQKTFKIYVSTPSVQFNSLHTSFIDLSNNAKNQGNNSENQDRKSDLLNQ